MSEPRPDGIPILHLEEEFVVVDKPGGLLVHRSRESTDRVFLLQEVGRQLDRYVHPVHRLDRAASGLIVFAFTREATRRLQECLTAGDAVKEYLALVRGEAPDQGEIDRPLSDQNGVKKAARTSYLTVGRFNRSSLLKVRIHSGRRHQIRRHLSHLAHQIIGDTSHGKGKINRFLRREYGLPRLFLHAWRLDIQHPIRKDERLRVSCPLAQDLREFLGRLPDTNADFIANL